MTLDELAGDDTWSSPRARLCEAMLARNLHQLHRAADDLRDTAFRMQARAGELDLVVRPRERGVSTSRHGARSLLHSRARRRRVTELRSLRCSDPAAADALERGAAGGRTRSSVGGCRHSTSSPPPIGG